MSLVTSFNSINPLKFVVSFIAFSMLDKLIGGLTFVIVFPLHLFVRLEDA